MSKTALLAQNDNTAIEAIKQKVGRSVFDLSHSTTFPIDVDGAILPICCVETVPSDSFEISCEALLRQLSPLKVPLMTNLRLNTAWYWCDNRLAWPKWERFMTGGRSGNEVYEIPQMCNVEDVIVSPATEHKKFDLFDTTPSSGVVGTNADRSNTLHTYFGLSFNKDASSTLGDESDELPLAFSSFDYQIICRDFYTDVDRLNDNPATGNDFYDYSDVDSDWAYSTLFPSDDDDFKLADGIQIQSGIHSHKGPLLDKVRYHNVRDDYFTTSKKAPMRGDIPEIDIGVSSASIDFSKSVLKLTDSETTSKDFYYVGFDNAHDKLGLTQSNAGSAENQQLNGLTGNKKGMNSSSNFFLDRANAGTTDTPSQRLLNALNNAEITVNNFQKVNAAELRLLSQLTVWQELNGLHKPYYNDFLNAHFENVRVGESPVEKPQFIGGTSQLININQIVQVSASTETSALGNQGATAQSLANNYVGKFFCNNYGFLIGVAYIIPDMLYNPAIPRQFSRRTKEDYYSPEFANLSMQATLNKEIFFSNDSDWNNTPWGYVGCYDELRSIPNRVAGDMLNPSYTDLKAWTLRREFANDNLPSMSHKFECLKNNVDKTAWAVPSMPAFILQCANFIKAVRPLPYIAIPKAL